MAEYSSFLGSQQIRVAIAANTDSQDLVSQVETFLNQDLETELTGTTNSSGEDCLQRLYDWQADILLLAEGLGEGRRPELELARMINRRRPNTGVLIMASSAHFRDPDYLHEAIKAGVAEVLNAEEPELPSWKTSINRAHTLVRERLEAKEYNGQILVFHSLKGGIGKTLLATNLSAALAAAEHRVLFIDLCWPFGGAESYLNLQHPSTSILDLIRVINHLSPGDIANASIAHRENLRILTAPVESERANYLEDILSGRLLEDAYLNLTEILINQAEIANIQLGISDADRGKLQYLKLVLRKIRVHQALHLLVRRLLSTAERAYDFIIIDAPANVDDTIMYTLRQADKILVICSPDVPVIQATRAELKLLKDMQISAEKVSLILNRTSKSKEIRPDEVMNLFHEDDFEYLWLGQVPDDPSIESYVNTSTLPVEAPKATSFAQAVQQLVQQLAVQQVEVP